MLDRYIDFINQHISETNDQKLLLAISGGVDSMVMLDVSIKADLAIAVAHVNHGMRGIDSDADEKLVRDICFEHGISFHSYRFTESEKSANNFQERAREIRYSWWSQLCKDEGYDYVLTAHHSSDRVETFLLNLTRGSGIRGLSSIPTINQNILRPLYDVSKKEVLEYSKLNKVAYREDSSNQESKYKRNSIRNEWIPFLKTKEPNIENAIVTSVSNLSKEKALLYQLVESAMSENSSIENNGYQHIILSQLNERYNINVSQLLYQYLNQYGFTEDNCIKCLTASVGSEFHTETHELLRDRDKLILRNKTKFNSVALEIEDYGFYKIDNHVELRVSNDPSFGGMCISGLKFPFTIRHKLVGDKFCPSGMAGASQKLKDFLTNAKLDKWSKQSTLVVEQNAKIAAVLPLRVAHGFSEDFDGPKVFVSVHHS